MLLKESDPVDAGPSSTSYELSNDGRLISVFLSAPDCEMEMVLKTHYLLVRNKQLNPGEAETWLALCKGSLSQLSLLAHLGLHSLYKLTLTNFQPHHFIHKPF